MLQFAVVFSLTSISSAAFALVNPNSFYDSISWTWSYSDVATTSYNCLGYATGSMTWEWAWDSNMGIYVRRYLIVAQEEVVNH